MKRAAPTCPYCEQPSEQVTGAVIYPRRPDLAQKVIYRCEPCAAWVGCHPGTDIPLGRLANKALRDAKQAAHAAFDPLWKAKKARDNISTKAARTAGYRWLATQLGIDAKDCHIGMFDEQQCQRVVELCSNRCAA